MSSDAPGTSETSPPAPAETRLPIVELDRALAPIRRLASWGSSEPVARAAAVPYLESTVDRWVAAAKALDLPESVGTLLDAQREAVAGYDTADASTRSEQLASLHPAVCRVDALLGLPLHGVPIRRPRKPRLPDWRVEEKPEPPVQEASSDLDDSADADDDKPLVARRRKRKAKEEPPPPLPPFWNGRISARVHELDIPAGWADSLKAAGVETAEDLLLLRPASTETLRPIHGAGRALPEDADRVAIGGRVKRRWTTLSPDGTVEHRLRLKGAGPVDLVWSGDSRALSAAGGLSAFEVESRAVFAGRAQVLDEDRVELLEAELAFEDGAGGVRIRSYGLADLDDVVVRGIIGRMLPLANQVRDLLPSGELARNKQEPLRALLAELHHRDEERARRRLAFDEALLVQAGLSLERYRQNRDRGLQVTPLHSLLSRLDVSHGLSLNDDQQVVFEDIKRDLRRKTPMRRVVTGRAGSGRGLLGLLTVAAVAEGNSGDGPVSGRALGRAALPVRGHALARGRPGRPARRGNPEQGRAGCHRPG